NYLQKFEKAIKKDGRNKPNKNSLLKISEEDVRKLAERFWTITEIAAFFNCSDKTISNRFSDIVVKGKENGRAKLRDIQLRSAMNGNVTMQIWLGKQYLKQTDKQETDITLPTEIIIELPSSFTDED
ncbi:MAG: hypothetical protein IPG78_15130, partial [Ignavibacteria bacterium]|nr:hypothetical protein [Ignavibacteria bacterium]